MKHYSYVSYNKVLGFCKEKEGAQGIFGEMKGTEATIRTQPPLIVYRIYMLGQVQIMKIELEEFIERVLIQNQLYIRRIRNGQGS